jgi:tetratricopeptide (TPR) repeat protein
VPRSKPTVTITGRMLAVSFDADTDRLTVCQFGALPERQLPECRLQISEHLRFFMRRPGGRVIGFEVRGLHVLDVDCEVPSLWSGPRFRVPTLGLTSAVVAEIVLRARVVLAGRSTPDVLALHRANGLWAAGDLVAAEGALREALAAGSLQAHLTLGSCLAARGMYREAYDHTRAFTELAPRDSRGWACLGRSCVELGDNAEAAAALRRAVGLERKGSYETFATHLLASLESGPSESPW